jgi:hypothetical protein
LALVQRCHSGQRWQWRVKLACPEAMIVVW